MQRLRQSNLFPSRLERLQLLLLVCLGRSMLCPSHLYSSKIIHPDSVTPSCRRCAEQRLRTIVRDILRSSPPPPSKNQTNLQHRSRLATAAAALSVPTILVVGRNWKNRTHKKRRSWRHGCTRSPGQGRWRKERTFSERQRAREGEKRRTLLTGCRGWSLGNVET